MSRMRQRIAQRLKESQNTTAMLTTFQEVDAETQEIMVQEQNSKTASKPKRGKPKTTT